MIYIRSEQEINCIRESNRIVAETLNMLAGEIRPGVTTRYLDQKCEECIRDHGGVPAFKGYQGFPNALCISLNEEIVHGIPGSREIVDGDIVSCDVGVLYRDYFGDAARTFPVGEISKQASRLLQVTQESLDLGIEMAVVGNRLYDIGHAIQKHVERNGFSVVRMFVGHGIGRKLHEDPQIPNYGAPGRGIRLKEGMVFALEPMVNVGTYRVKILDDGWTAVTEDGSLSAHFEHTIVVRSDRAEILSQMSSGVGHEIKEVC